MKNNASLVYNVCLVIGDYLTLMIAFTIAYVLRVSLNHTPISAPISSSTYFITIASLLPFWILIFSLMGLYGNRIHEKRFSEFGLLLVGSFVGILSIISYAYVSNTNVFPARLVTLYGFLLAFFFVLLFRTLARAIRRELFGYGLGINNVLIVGDTKVTQQLVDSLSHSAITGYRILGVVGGVKHPLKAEPYRLFESFEEALEKLHNTTIHTIVQTELYSNVEKNNAVLTYAQENHVAYRFVPGNSELLEI